MSRVYRYSALAVLLSITLACGLTAQPISPNEILIPPSKTPANAATIAPSDTPAPTNTEVASNTPAPTDTLVPLTATFRAFIAAQTQMVGTAVAQYGPMAHLSGFLMFYSDPVGDPLQNWNDVPIMPEATAGQEFQSDIYSYKADATLRQAASFYSGKSNSLGWSCMQATGSGGTGEQASHDVDFICGSLTIIATSFDNNTNHILVVINKSP